jgi:multiple sugar transport system substrate-binding protein
VRRRAIAVLAPGLTAALVGGCAAGPADCVRVVSWADFRELELEAEVIDSFRVRHPEIPVCLESLEGAGIYREKILTSIAAGTPPGVFLLDGIDAPAFIESDVLLDLAPYLPRVNLDLAAFHPRLTELFAPGGRVWAVPKGFTPMVMFYNRDVFDRAGVPYPPAGWTWEDFRRTARALTRDTDGDGATDVWGFGWPREFFYLQSWIWAGGGDLLAPDGRRASGWLDAPATIEALDFYLGLAVRDSVVPRVDMFRRRSGVPLLRLFTSGRLGMLQSGHWSMKTYREHEQAGRLRYGVAPLPVRPGVAPVTVLYSSAWAVPRAAAHRRWNVQVAAFMGSETAQRIRARGELELPGLMAVSDSVARADRTGREAVFLAAAAHGRQSWGTRVRKWREVEDVLLDLLDRPYVRGERLDAVAPELAGRIDALLVAPRR